MKERFCKRLLAMTLAIIMVLGMVPDLVLEADAADTGKAIRMNPSEIGANSHIYFGKNGETSIKWRVLDATKANDRTTNAMFLLSEYLLTDESVQFGSNDDSYRYQLSNGRGWCLNFAKSREHFRITEQAVMLGVAKDKDDEIYQNGVWYIDQALTQEDRMFLLSAKELWDYIGLDNGSATYNGTSYGWWLRSYAEGYSGAYRPALYSNRGNLNRGAVTGMCAMRPAFNLDIGRVAFASAADNRGHNAAFAVPADYSGTEWKLTLKDNVDFMAAVSQITGQTEYTENYEASELTLSHTALSDLSADYTNVTAMLTDSSGNVRYYGSVNSDCTATVSTIPIPAGLEIGTYTVTVRGEDWNGENDSDIASGTPYTFTVKVIPHEHAMVYTASGDTISAVCSKNNCTLENANGGSVTIAVPENTVYTGSTIEAVVTNALTTDTAVAVIYSGDGLVDGKPVKSGTYTASITLGDAVIDVEYTITCDHPDNLWVLIDNQDGSTHKEACACGITAKEAVGHVYNENSECGCGYNCPHNSEKYTDNGNGTHDIACSVCGKLKVDNEQHTFDTNGGCNCGNILPAASVTIGKTTTEYTSFAAAINAANNANTDCTIKLLRDTNETGTELFYIGKNGQLTVDFGTYTLTCDEFESGTRSSMKLIGTTGGVNGNVSFYGPFNDPFNPPPVKLPPCSIDSGVYHGTITSWLLGDVEINGGTFSSSGRMIYANDAPIEINGGTFTGAEGIRAEGYDANVNIRGGTFTLTDDSKTLLTVIDQASIRVYDGTFTAAIDAAADSTADLMFYGGTFKDGLKVKTTDLKSSLASGKQFYLDGVPQVLTDNQTSITGGDVTLGEKVVASVTTGDKTNYYKTFNEAVAAFNTSGGVLTLMDDITASQKINFTASGTLELNGFALSGGGQSIVVGNGTLNNSLTIRDSSEAETGKVTDQVMIHSQGTLTIESGGYSDVATGGLGSVVINGGTFNGYDHDLYCSVSGKITLNGGTFQNGVALNTNSNHGQTVKSILGSSKAYKIGDTYYLKTDLADETSLGAGETVTVVPEEDGVVATVTYNGTEYKFSSLTKAIAYEGSINMGSGDFVILNQDTTEDIRITNDIHINFNGKTASGVFTFDGGEIYIDGAFKEGTTLSVKKNGYSTDLSSDNVVIWGSNSLGLTADDLQPVDAGVKVESLGGGLALIHEHEWIYVLEDTQNGQKISAFCKHLETCPYAGFSNALGAWVELKDTEYYYFNTQWPASFGSQINSGFYTDDLPDKEDIIYYDANGTRLDGEPVHVGTYTAKLTFGNKTAEATLTIKPRPITVTADDKQKTYGDADPALTYTVSEETPLCGSDTLIGTLIRDTGEDADTYTIGQGTLTNANNPNYEITFIEGKLTIDPKKITVTADAVSKTYGNADPALTYEVEGLVNGDNLTGELKRVAGEDVGNYDIEQNTLTAGDNYIITYTGAKLTISKRNVTITAKDQTITYGGAISNAEITSVGLVNGHSVTLTLTPSTTNVTVDGTITASAAVITAEGTDVTANYEITCVGGKLVIAPDTSKIDGLTTENVTSANEADIKAVQEMMANADSIKDEWATISTTCEALLDKVEAVKAENARIADAVSQFNPTSVKSTDKAALKQLAEDIEALLDTENLTEDERTALEAVLEQVNGMIDTIEDTAEDCKAATDAVDALDPATVTSADKGKLEQAIEIIDELLQGDHLTEDERKALEDTKADAEDLIAKIDAAQNATDTENTEKVESVTPENVSPENKTDLEKAKTDLEKALEDNSGNYTEDEKKAIEDEIKRIEDALEVIGNVEAVEELIDKLPDTIKKDDEAAIKAADDAYKALTDYEKSLVDEGAKKALDDAKAALAELKKPADPNSPATGDNSDIWLWFALLFVSGAGVFGITLCDRKRKAVSKR